MKEVRVEKMAFPELNRAVSWEELFGMLLPKVSGKKVFEVAELKIDHNGIEIKTVIDDASNL